MNIRAIHCVNDGPKNTAFTLIEIALSIAIVAFALVAIIGVMPAGLNVQRENREEAIVNGDAKVIIEAIKAGNLNSPVIASRVDWVAIYSNGITIFTNVPPFPNGAVDVIGVMTTPGSNVVNVARVRGLSGSLGDVAGTAQDLTFAYLLSTQITPFNPNASFLAAYQSTNLWELRATMQWPAYPNGTVGNGRQSFRVMIAGQMITNGTYLTFNPSYFQTP
jgi:type II secretory pathway pseudopilin PulG